MDGIWQSDSEILEKLATAYYETLYTATPTRLPQVASWSFPPLWRQDLRWLNRGVTELEVKRDVFQMDGRKASGPDGVNATFFQKFWPIVGTSVTEFVKNAFLTTTFPISMNNTLISLIPKQQHLETLAQFRPIFLRIVVVKIISKVIANRLRPLMCSLTAPN